MSAPVSPADASAPATPDAVCVLCGAVFSEFGNNPWPLASLDDGRCCDMCNGTRVIPARLAGLVDA